METLNNVKTRLQFRPGDNDKECIKYDKEKVKERYLEQRKNLEILHYVLGKKPTESLAGISKKILNTSIELRTCSFLAHNF